MRSIALTIPAVIVSVSPNGLPIATTSSPGWTPEDEPIASGCSSDESMLTLITAVSVESSLPTSVAVAVLPSSKWTLIEDAPSTTCAAVTMSPFES